MDLALAFEDSQPFKLTVDQYEGLDEGGAFEDDPRIELIEGMIVRMNSQTSSHAIVTSQLAFRLHDRLGDIGSPLLALINPTVMMPPHNAPDPDIIVTRPPAGARYFPVEGVALIIEVSRTTLGRDLTVKRDIYARAAVPEYWVVDVNAAVVHRFADPRAGVYRIEPPIPLAGEIRSLTMPDLAIDGAGIL